MLKRTLAVLAVAGLAAVGAPDARAEDTLFGNLFGRLSSSEAPKAGESQDMRDRERETRNLRREYWERERARMSQSAAAQPTPGAALSTDVSSRSLAAR
ncbi:hypothetical protein [Roseomonas indoligenes]|uniref:Uncharacterized protein n=1 Tax=Roseomonas indoligenes TaxID=2820811 RepID=A0A940S3Y5_9PROT|nr:hypothetical protein [Pararoseomonas indoligenes]MBP0492731.1 hypothetical protein [Pararoseomonas indoligenes]